MPLNTVYVSLLEIPSSSDLAIIYFIRIMCVFREKEKHIQDLELKLPRVLSDISRHRKTKFLSTLIHKFPFYSTVLHLVSSCLIVQIL